MPKSKPIPLPDPSTEDKIKTAAREVFHQKGFAATRTRDIADAAGINLALLNYYFRSKQKLFDLIMLETLQSFLQTIGSVVHDENSTLKKKIETLAHRYIDLLIQEPEIPLFIMSELRANPNNLLNTMNPKKMLMKSSFVHQFQEAVKKGDIPPQHFLHFMMNLLGMITFPFIASPLLKNIGDLKDDQFNTIMKERKKLIPLWMNAIMKTKS